MKTKRIKKEFTCIREFIPGIKEQNESKKTKYLYDCSIETESTNKPQKDI